MVQVRITPLLQAQLVDQIGTIRKLMDAGYWVSAFNSLETLVSMLAEKDSVELEKDLQKIKERIFAGKASHKKFDRVLNARAINSESSRIIRLSIRKVFTVVMRKMYSSGYMQIEEVKARFANTPAKSYEREN